MKTAFKRIFGKKVVPAGQPTGSPALPPQGYGDSEVEIGMDQVAEFAYAMAKHRGYPEDTASMIARRVVFLERRDFPGLVSLYREVTLFSDEPLLSRFDVQRPDGREGGFCPFYAGLELEPEFERFTVLPPDQQGWALAPSNSFLLVPKLAEWLRPTGRRAMMWWAKDKSIVGYIVVEGYRLQIFFGRGADTLDSLDKIQAADHIGFSGCPEDFHPQPNPRSGFLEKKTLRRRDIGLMESYLRT